MSGLELWISENVWAVLIVGLALSLVLAALGVRYARFAVRRRRSGAASRWAWSGPVALFALAAVGLFFFTTGSVVMGPGLVGQYRLLGEPAPAIHFARVSDGGEASLADYRGSVVLVNLWATWCPPCRHELPDLDRLQSAYRDRGLVVLHISDEPRRVLEEFLADSPMGTEHGFVAAMPLPEAGRPTTYVIDRAGIVRRVLLGPRSYEQFEAEIGRHL